MNRRGFIQITSVALIPILLGIFPKGRPRKGKYTIKVQSNRAFGHLLREMSTQQPTIERTTDCVIVGGGIAGVAAATQLKGTDFLLFEADDCLGGSSASHHWKDTVFATGAHYELAYPETYGKEVIELLTAMKLIEFNRATKLYEFTDQKYVINAKHLEQCFIDGETVEDVLEGGTGLTEFTQLLAAFRNVMPLPTRLISEEFHYLNELTFSDFLASKMTLTKDLKQRVDYQMLDDWGGKSDTVSALAGIHYYTCRPYEEQDVPLFSPPNGNGYFIENMVGFVDQPEAFETSSLVRAIREVADGVEVEVIKQNREIELIRAKHVIFAGQKHALKYLFQTEQPLFNASYAPWLVINFVCQKGIDFSKWQNDVLTDQLEFLGFVSSVPQHTRSERFDVFTAYFCLSELKREELVTIEENPSAIIERTIDIIRESTTVDITEKLEHVNVKLMGHAMPIPKPGYLSFKDVPSYSDKLTFAGVDTGRLPLFYEACDSGIQAGRRANNMIKNIAT